MALCAGFVFMLRSVGVVPKLSCSVFYFFNWFVECASVVGLCAVIKNPAIAAGLSLFLKNIFATNTAAKIQ